MHGVFLGLGDETGDGSMRMSDIMTQTQDDYAAQNDLILSFLMRTVLVYVQGALRKLCACGEMCCSHPTVKRETVKTINSEQNCNKKVRAHYFRWSDC